MKCYEYLFWIVWKYCWLESRVYGSITVLDWVSTDLQWRANIHNWENPFLMTQLLLHGMRKCIFPLKHRKTRKNNHSGIFWTLKKVQVTFQQVEVTVMACDTVFTFRSPWVGDRPTNDTLPDWRPLRRCRNPQRKHRNKSKSTPDSNRGVQNSCLGHINHLKTEKSEL